MRDHPGNNWPMVAGMWGANNYVNLTRAYNLKTKLFNTAPYEDKTSDQFYLKTEVWPGAR